MIKISIGFFEVLRNNKWYGLSKYFSANDDRTHYFVDYHILNWLNENDIPYHIEIFDNYSEVEAFFCLKEADFVFLKLAFAPHIKTGSRNGPVLCNFHLDYDVAYKA